MSSERSAALAYLRAPFNGCWSWAENGKVLVWRDGTTVAFIEEVEAVLDRLAPQGLPPFSAVALLLAACRGKRPLPEDIMGEDPRSNESGKEQLLNTTRQQLRVQVQGLIRELEKARQLPADLLGRGQAKAVLAEMAFEGAKLERQTQADEVLRALKGPFLDEELNASEEGDGWTVNQVGNLYTVARGLRNYDVEKLRLRLLTSLEALPKEAAIELGPAEQARLLLAELSNLPEYAGLARATYELMAAIRLPRRLIDRDELAIGGVADLSNRGPLDRLVLSELAHDDLTLATRVALNEALYLRREPPECELPSTLAVLVDSGVRLWGVPRIFAVAVALALIARERKKIISTWRAHGAEVVPVNLLTRPGLLQHLAALETASHPGQALPAFAQARLRDQTDRRGVDDALLITERRTLEDFDFRRALQTDHKLSFIATVDRDGTFELHSMPLAHRPPICAARLELKALFDPPPSVELVARTRDPRLPLIFACRPFPILLPVHGKLESAWPNSHFLDGRKILGRLPEGGTGVCRDGRILSWASDQVGAQQISAGIPRGGRTLWLEHFGPHKVSLLKRLGKARLILIHAEASARACESHELAVGRVAPAAIYRQKRVLLLIGFASTEVCDLDSNRLIGKSMTPARMWHQSGRFFVQNGKWFFVRWDGQGVRWEPVSFAISIPVSEVLTVFDSQGFEGPLVLTRGGEVFDPSGDKLFSARREIVWAKVSRYGQRILVHDQSSQYHVIDLRDRFVTTISNVTRCMESSVNGEAFGQEPTLEPRIARPNRELRSHFTAIHAREPGVLTLHSPKGTGLVLGPVIGIHLMVRAKEKHAVRHAAAIGFRPVPTQSELGCRLQVAQWPNGSRAFLDSRGLLHLKSHDPAIAEISLVLQEGDAAGWASDGFLAGPPFFGAKHSGSEKELAKRFVAFVESIC